MHGATEIDSIPASFYKPQSGNPHTMATMFCASCGRDVDTVIAASTQETVCTRCRWGACRPPGPPCRGACSLRLCAPHRSILKAASGAGAHVEETSRHVPPQALRSINSALNYFDGDKLDAERREAAIRNARAAVSALPKGRSMAGMSLSGAKRAVRDTLYAPATSAFGDDLTRYYMNKVRILNS